jgi:hypothetical protein
LITGETVATGREISAAGTGTLDLASDEVGVEVFGIDELSGVRDDSGIGVGTGVCANVKLALPHKNVKTTANKIRRSIELETLCINIVKLIEINPQDYGCGTLQVCTSLKSHRFQKSHNNQNKTVLVSVLTGC